MEEPINFIVRPLPRGATLEGAFRVHIASKDLDSLRIRPGELCHLATADGATGTGIAWRSIEPNTKANAHPIKVTDTLRDAFNFKLGNELTISKSTSTIYHATKVVITDVSDHSAQDAAKDDTNWNWRCGNILGSVEAIANGVAFEATSRKGLRKRFLIESIVSSRREGSNLYYFDDRSELVMQDESAGPTPAFKTQPLILSTEGIGGLNKQIELLNRRLGRLIGEVKGRKIPANFRRNGGILLYGPQGTGKSLLLKRISQMGWRKVLRIDRSMLPGVPTKNQAAIANAFTDALAQQPSLIVMDNLQHIAGSQESNSSGGDTAETLAVEMGKLAGSRVLVVGATTSLNDVDKSLRAPGKFEYEFEIPIPDMKARVEILKAIHKETDEFIQLFDDLAENIGERTHGFVGQDLAALYRTAQDHAIDRTLDDEDWSVNRAERDSLTTLVNGLHRPSVWTFSSVETTADDVAEVELTMEDFEKALLEIRPTAMREVFLETPKVSWSQIGGSADVKQMLEEVIEWPLKQRKNMEDLGMSAQKGILLYGPPGCSKTLTAKAVATSSGLNFIAVKGAELLSMYVGESERAVREVFRKARAAAPSIIFFDEIDSIASERGAQGSSGLNVLTTLLNEMDGIESLNGVLVLAATNKPESLDSALLRPGRFDKMLYIGPPNEQARREILKIRTDNVPLASDVDITEIAKQTKGFSGAEMVGICQEATEETMRRRIALDKAGADPTDDRRRMCKKDFDLVLSKAVTQLSDDMIEHYERWRKGLRV